jgi:hypothetical protein
MEARRGTKVVMKLLYGHSFKPIGKLVKHLVVKPAHWSRIGSPIQDESPGVVLEVVSYHYHRPLLWESLAKYIVADRRACLSRSNVQYGRDLEMMVHQKAQLSTAFMTWHYCLGYMPTTKLKAYDPTHAVMVGWTLLQRI